MTALTLITEAYSVKEGDFVLVHAAAGGTGQVDGSPKYGHLFHTYGSISMCDSRIGIRHDNAPLPSLPQILYLSIPVHTMHGMMSGEQIMVQLASHLGAHVIGTTSSEAKADLARSLGAKDVILYNKQVRPLGGVGY